MRRLAKTQSRILAVHVGVTDLIRLDTEGLPKAACPGGIRSNILYPTCWDGKNLDSPDHKVCSVANASQSGSS
jgi:hypothetical protein